MAHSENHLHRTSTVSLQCRYTRGVAVRAFYTADVDGVPTIPYIRCIAFRLAAVIRTTITSNIRGQRTGIVIRKIRVFSRDCLVVFHREKSHDFTVRQTVIIIRQREEKQQNTIVSTSAKIISDFILFFTIVIIRSFPPPPSLFVLFSRLFTKYIGLVQPTWENMLGNRLVPIKNMYPVVKTSRVLRKNVSLTAYFL